MKTMKAMNKQVSSHKRLLTMATETVQTTRQNWGRLGVLVAHRSATKHYADAVRWGGKVTGDVAVVALPREWFRGICPTCDASPPNPGRVPVVTVSRADDNMHHVVWPEAGAVYGDNVDDTVGVRAALVAAERCIEASTRLPSPLAVVLVYRWNDGQFQSRVFSWADDRSALEAALRERAAKHVEQACGFISEFQSEGARVVGVLVAEDDDWCPTVRRILVEVIATTNAPGGAA